ncbi:ABC transporter permease [Phytomonospora sp. NPDC050363]|uniref:ABC transporter permease n=1 Tax=Phytomonospora sp. NPDC050363 TaxID=3155642 RepID=UPI0033DE9636
MATVRIYIFDSVVLPLVLATIALRMAGPSADPATLTSLTFGAAVMGMWAAALSGTGGAISRMRSMALLEPIVAAPTPLAAALAANALASASLGLYSLVATVLWAKFGLKAPIEIASPALLVPAFVLTVVATAALGVTLSVSLVMFRRAQSVSNLFEYPFWIFTGAMVPITLLPAWFDSVSWFIGPAWGMKAIRSAAVGDASAVGVALLAGFAVTAAYWTVSMLLLRSMERLARERAALPLS